MTAITCFLTGAVPVARRLLKSTQSDPDPAALTSLALLWGLPPPPMVAAAVCSLPKDVHVASADAPESWSNSGCIARGTKFNININNSHCFCSLLIEVE